jgi:hypothetical protein
VVPQIVTSTVTQDIHYKRSALTRALSVLLLTLIVYGTTVEAVHRHGSVGSKSTSTSSVSDSGSGKTQSLKLAGCNDCLICQLHQNFSSSLISIRSAITAVSVAVHYLDSTRPSTHSRTNAPQPGRAPPQAS